MPENKQIPDSFLQFMREYQQASRPNALEALGTGMAGFAAPFLGQQWKNPFLGQRGGSIDPVSMMLMKDVMSQSQETRKAEQQVATKKAKNVEDMRFAADRVKNLLTSTVRAWKSVKETTEQSPIGLKPGRLAGMANVVGGITGMNPEVKPYEGQKLETAAALARIAMPGIRSERAINTFYKTLPTIASNEKEMVNQIRNSYHNAMSTMYGSMGLNYDEKERVSRDKELGEILKSEGYSVSGTKRFVIKGKTYNIPEDMVADFKKEMGLK